jgi:hypothetical protein
MGYAATSHNRTVYASPPVGGSGYGFARSIASLHSHAKPPPHFVGPGLCFAKPLSGPPKRRKQPERYAKLDLKFVEIYKKSLKIVRIFIFF